MKATEDKKCLACSKVIRGRIDKKFCDDYCRNNYNNQLKSGETKLVRNIVNALRKNRLILQQAIGNEEVSKTSKEKLLAEGFQFKYHTNKYDNKKGSVYYFCFDYGYLPLDNDWVLVVKAKNNIS